MRKRIISPENIRETIKPHRQFCIMPDGDLGRGIVISIRQIVDDDYVTYRLAKFKQLEKVGGRPTFMTEHFDFFESLARRGRLLRVANCT